MLPIVWLAMFGTWRQLIIGLVAMTLALVVPFLVFGDPRYPVTSWRSALLFLVVAALTGVAIQSLVVRVRRTNETLAGVLRNATETAIVATDASGTITVFNRGAERMLGYDADEVVGKASAEMLHDPEEVAARADELGVEAGPEVFVSLGPSHSGGRTCARTAGGSRVAVGYHRVRRRRRDHGLPRRGDRRDRAPARGGRGQGRARLLGGRDRHRRQPGHGPRRPVPHPALQPRVRAAHRPLRGRGPGPEPCPSSRSWPRRSETIEARLRHATPADFPIEFEVEWLDEHREPRLIAWSNNCLVGPDGEIEHIVAAGTDITDRREALRRAMEASRAKSEFLANMSHEIRTPHERRHRHDRAAAGHRARRRAARVRATASVASGDALLTIINDILDFSKIEAGKLELEVDRLRPAPGGRGRRRAARRRGARQGPRAAPAVDGAVPGSCAATPAACARC